MTTTVGEKSAVGDVPASDVDRSTAAVPLVLRVSGPDRMTVEARLGEAELLAQLEATKSGGGGVLITRLAHDQFTVEVSDEVPFGVTLESCAMKGREI